MRRRDEKSRELVEKVLDIEMTGFIKTLIEKVREIGGMKKRAKEFEGTFAGTNNFRLFFIEMKKQHREIVVNLIKEVA